LFGQQYLAGGIARLDMESGRDDVIRIQRDPGFFEGSQETFLAIVAGAGVAGSGVENLAQNLYEYATPISADEYKQLAALGQDWNVAPDGWLFLADLIPRICDAITGRGLPLR
jgi:hypothetical protein